jgi:hypothetical protein
MKTGVKIALGIVGGLAVLALLVVGAGYYFWVTKGKAMAAEFAAKGKVIMADAEAFGRGKDSDQCIQEALTRFKAGSGIVQQVEVQVFLSSSLKTCSPKPELCNEIPEEGEILKTVAWRLKKSQDLGLQDSNNPIVRGIQEYCNKRGQAAAAH